MQIKLIHSISMYAKIINIIGEINDYCNKINTRTLYMPLDDSHASVN